MKNQSQNKKKQIADIEKMLNEEREGNMQLRDIERTSLRLLLQDLKK